MADNPHSASHSAPPKNGGGAANEAFESAKGAAASAARQAKDGARATAEAVASETAQAAEATTKAQGEIVRTQLEAAQEAVSAGLETGVRNIEGLTRTWTRAIGLSPDADLAQRSAQNVRAVSQASTALAKGAQDASRAWIELTQKTARSNVQAFGQIAGCRSLQEILALQSQLVRENLQQLIESSEAVARASSDAIREATRAMQTNA